MDSPETRPINPDQGPLLSPSEGAVAEVIVLPTVITLAARKAFLVEKARQDGLETADESRLLGLVQDGHKAELRMEDDALPIEQIPFQAQVVRQAQVAKNILALANLDLIEKISHRFWSKTFTYDDKFQEGAIGLMRAVDTFDPAKEIPFSAWATNNIKWAIRKALRDRDEIVSTSRPDQEAQAKILESESWLTSHLRRTPTIEEISADTGISVERIQDVRTRSGMTFLDNIQVNSDLDRLLTDRTANTEQIVIDQNTFKLGVERAYKRHVISDEERMIVSLRVDQQLSQQEIADIIGQSQPEVGRRLKKIAGKLVTYVS